MNRISPEAPVPVVSVEEKDERAGGAANVALNLKALGADVLLCSVVGKDDAGKSLTRILKKNKISVDGLLTSANRITSVKTRVLSRNHQMIRYDSEMTSDLLKSDEQLLVKKVKELITKEKPQALIFEDYNKGVLTPALIEEVIAACRAKKILTTVDPKKKNFFAYKNTDVFKPNLREIREALNDDISVLNRESLSGVAVGLKKILPHKITLITLSERGMFFHAEKEVDIIPAHKRDISDVSGAGDTVIAVVTLCLASGMALKDSVEMANIAGGLVCEYVGVVPVTKEMLIREFKED